MAESVSEGGEGLLCACQVSGLKCLANRGEVLGAICPLERFRIAERTVLAKCGQSVKGLPRRVHVARLQRLSQLLDVGFSLLSEILLLLEDRFGAGNFFRAARLLRSTQVHTKCRKVLACIVVVSEGFWQGRNGWFLEN
jgi:hypothetical protein